MLKWRADRESGQSLIIIAFVMTAILIFTAFAVDLGYWYIQRRQMQNAADAGALVGARELALHQAADVSTLTNGQLYAIILDWARRNQAKSIEPLYIREDETRWAIPNNGDLAPLNYTDAVGVHVKANTDFQSFFARILGINTLDASAIAEAKYGGTLAAYGPCPLAYEYQPEAFEVCNPEDEDYDESACEFQLFSGTDKNSNAQWGWLGLDCMFPSKCSPDVSSLVYWMQNGFPGDVFIEENYMGDPGVAAAVLKEAQIGDILILPLFDRVFQYTDKDYTDVGTVRCATYPDGNPYPHTYVDGNGGFYDGYVIENGVPTSDWDRTSYCATECTKDYTHVWCAHTDNSVLTNSYYYHIVQFAAFKITAVSQGGHILDGVFQSYVAEGTWKKPTEWDKGVVIIHLTE